MPLDTTDLAALRQAIRQATLADEAACLTRLRAAAALDEATRARIGADAAGLVTAVRNAGQTGLIENFLAEYGLSTREGVALMCLAEALLRVPDAGTIDALIEDKIAPSRWSAHLGRSSSPLVNASTWALMLTGGVLRDEDGTGVAGALRGLVKRLGEPVIRAAVAQAMRELGRQFVLGRDIDEALREAAKAEAEGYTFSYDMLGEAARTGADARRYTQSYAGAIGAIGKSASAAGIGDNPGISIKLSALHPRYEQAQRARVMAELTPTVLSLAVMAKANNLGLNIDAEEAERLDLSLDVIEAVLRDPALAGWDGFGVVVQAYGPRALPLIDWLAALAADTGRRVMVRLVKGAYWDAEIKRAQVLGLSGFPVFTRKALTDISYLACARALFDAKDLIYPQFATHNAHSAAAILAMAPNGAAFEFQRLHGMGAALHRAIRDRHATRCRVYAPVGPHRDLLAYLVRRLLENGANSSFVHQIADPAVPTDRIAADPLDTAARIDFDTPAPGIVPPPLLFGTERVNAKGWDLTDPATLESLEAARAPFRAHRWNFGRPQARAIVNPADPADIVGRIDWAGAADVDPAVAAARAAQPGWRALGAAARGDLLRRVADLYEANAPELFALAAREAGKTPPDAVAELREAVDFLRYYAHRAETIDEPPRGLVACVSPWNFPLAIFTGQIAAALATGNAVLAKPAEQTGLMAARAVRLFAQAGLPDGVVTLLPGDGADVGAALVAHPGIDAVCFTGSTDTARAIDRAMAARGNPAAPLIAETGGLNAMIVDSTALPEQAVRDILASAFQSAGQRCSALRMLYVQEDIAADFLTLLTGAMDELALGDPWHLATDIGPVIDEQARGAIMAHIDAARAEGRLRHTLAAPSHGTFVAPTLIDVTGIADLRREIFGPVLHVATYKAEALDEVIAAINATGHGLTFGLHTRIDDRVQHVSERVRAGNLYVNRNQIGAIVGSQPFGGEGLSGTGPKAGGPHYLKAFVKRSGGGLAAVPGRPVGREEIDRALAALSAPPDRPLSGVDLPGPTGESNRLSLYPRGLVLCLGPDAESARAQAELARAAGNAALAIAPGLAHGDGLDGTLRPETLGTLPDLAVVLHYGAPDALRPVRLALADRPGPLVPLIAEPGADPRLTLERHLCVDTTASGGNATLMAAQSG